MIDIFDVLSDETRREILVLLRQPVPGQTSSSIEASVSEIVAATGLSQPTVSKQLKVLREAQLVAVREDGQHRLYRLDVTPLHPADAWISRFLPRDAVAPEPVLRAARAFGGAIADLVAKAPWR
ncbi:MAG: ArsR/SmtB family transcription factor [Microbacteriaceae bacterium]